MDKRYNSYLRNYITLNEGEKFCDKCKGKGKVQKGVRNLGKTGLMLLVCSECLGDGKIDWVEEVLGKQRKVVMNYEFTADAEL